MLFLYELQFALVNSYYFNNNSLIITLLKGFFFLLSFHSRYHCDGIAHTLSFGIAISPGLTSLEEIKVKVFQARRDAKAYQRSK